MSASSKTITGALPPSSRWTRLSVCAAAFATSLPVATSPVRDTISTLGCRTIPAPTGSPSPVITLRTPPGKRSAASSAILKLGHPQSRQGRLLGGFENDSVSRRQGGANLPDRHHQGVVPWGDLANYAHRLATDHGRVPSQVLTSSLALHNAAGTREE